MVFGEVVVFVFYELWLFGIIEVFLSVDIFWVEVVFWWYVDGVWNFILIGSFLMMFFFFGFGLGIVVNKVLVYG